MILKGITKSIQSSQLFDSLRSTCNFLVENKAHNDKKNPVAVE